MASREERLEEALLALSWRTATTPLMCWCRGGAKPPSAAHEPDCAKANEALAWAPAEPEQAP